jgi:hypothetical protein
MAEVTARELAASGGLDLLDALDLTALAARKDRTRGARFAVRWLNRLLSEQLDMTIEDCALAASALAVLGGPHHDDALATLRAMSQRAAGAKTRPGVAS